MANKSANSTSRSIEREALSVQSTDPRKRQKTNQSILESFSLLSASPPATIPSPAVQPQSFLIGGESSAAPNRSEPQKNAGNTKADCYRAARITPTEVDPELLKQRKPVCGNCYRYGKSQDCDGGPECMVCKSQRLICVYHACGCENCNRTHCGYIHDDQWDSEKERGLRLVRGKNW